MTTATAQSTQWNATACGLKSTVWWPTLRPDGGRIHHILASFPLVIRSSAARNAFRDVERGLIETPDTAAALRLQSVRIRNFAAIVEGTCQAPLTVFIG